MTATPSSDSDSVADPRDLSHTVRVWDDLIGHDRIRQWLGTAIVRQRLTGSFLLVGAPGVGKRTIADLLARTLLCESNDPAQMAPCGSCDGCKHVAAGTHPDVVRVAKPDDKSVLPLELLIGPDDARMQQGFCRDVRLKPFRGKRKIAILEDADFLNEEGANCLLKTLEEPPLGAVVLLIGTSEQKQLPTVRSRCRILRVGPLLIADATRLLRQAHGVQASEQQIRDAIDISGGDIHVARRLLAEQDADGLRSSLIKQLSTDQPDPIAIRRLVASHVDQAGKEAPKRRAAMRDVFSIAVQHFRLQMRNEVVDGQANPITLARLDRSVRALREVDRNANQSTLIECFAADISGGVTADRGGIGS